MRLWKHKKITNKKRNYCNKIAIVTRSFDRVINQSDVFVCMFFFLSFDLLCKQSGHCSIEIASAV